MIQVEGIFSGGGSVTSAPVIGVDFNWTGGDGTYQVLDDGDDNWRIKFLSSGTFTPLRNMVIDAFLVGGGGGKGYWYCGGGGAGYTTTGRSIVLAANTAYSITVGAAGINGISSSKDGQDGGTTSAFSLTAAGGKGTLNGSEYSQNRGGDGGSGGGGYRKTGSRTEVANGGTDGGNGVSEDTNGGTGQGATTREFGEADGDLYASGGGRNLRATVVNSGNGGGYSSNSIYVAPADGIVIIRQHKEATA